MEPQQKIEALERRVAELEALVIRQAAIIERQEARIQELERRLRLNSSNSSKPPSSDPPGAPPPVAPKSPSGRKPGGQPGHPPANREPFPPEQVDQFVRVYPKQCRQCRRKFPASSHEKMLLWLQHQVVDIPPVSARVTEYQCFGGACGRCGTWNVEPVPPDAAGLVAGPRLQGIASLLSGRFRLSRREVEEALVALFGPKAELALGTISNLEEQTAAALAPAYEEAHQAAQASARAHFDETGWTEGRKRAWLWTMVTAMLTVFRIDRHRSREAFEALAGSFQGVLCSDRWRVYLHWAKRLHQFCWAHLKRDWKSWEDLGGAEGKLGSACSACERKVMHLWGRFKKGEISRATLRAYLRPVQRRLRRLLVRGRRLKAIERPCKELLAYWPCLWVFPRVPGVEPTNNNAEQAIRPAVLWRKGSFGSHSAEGSRFVERMLTLVASLRKQGRAVLEFLVDAIKAQRLGRRGPTLLPDPGG